MPTKKKPSPKTKHHLDKRADLLAVAPEAMGSDDELLTTREVADWLRVSPEWLEIGRGKNYGPRFKRLGPTVIRYQRGTVREYLKEREYAHTKQYMRNES